MEGEPIQQAFRTAYLVLQSLPKNIYFNIFFFGSSYTQLYQARYLYFAILVYTCFSAKFTDATLQQARDYLKQSEPKCLGGTEICNVFDFGTNA